MLLPHPFAPLLGEASSSAHVVFERVARHPRGNHAAAERALGLLGVSADTWTLFHTQWGQPRFRRSRRVNEKPGASAPVISFSDEGRHRLAAVAHGAGLVGLGLDVLAVSRFHRYARDAQAMRRFLQRICSPEEMRDHTPAGLWSADELLAMRFGMKEAVSKALGTGLRLGLGLGTGFGIPLRSVAVHVHDTSVAVTLTGSARARMRRLGIRRFETHVGRSRDLLLTLVLAWR